VRCARRRVLYKICKKVYFNFPRARAARARCVDCFIIDIKSDRYLVGV